MDGSGNLHGTTIYGDAYGVVFVFEFTPVVTAGRCSFHNHAIARKVPRRRLADSSDPA